MVVDTFANMTQQITMIPWLLCDVQVVVAIVTRSVISSSEQFSAVQRVEMITILFFVKTCSVSPHNVCISLIIIIIIIIKYIQHTNTDAGGEYRLISTYCIN